MTLTLALLALTLVLSFGLLLLNLRSAPEGYEDETGFHVGKGAVQGSYESISLTEPVANTTFAKVAVTRQVAA